MGRFIISVTQIPASPCRTQEPTATGGSRELCRLQTQDKTTNTIIITTTILARESHSSGLELVTQTLGDCLVSRTVAMGQQQLAADVARGRDQQ